MSSGTTFHGPSVPRGLAAWSLVGLTAGLGLGLLGNAGLAPWVRSVSSALDPLGHLWINALQMAVIPLVIAQLLAAIVGNAEAGIGRLGARTLGLLAVLMIVFGTFSLIASHPLVAPLEVSPETADALRAQVVVPESARLAAEAGEVPFGEWAVGLVPTNVMEAAANGNILGVLIFVVLLGVAVTRLPADQRGPLAGLFRAAAQATMTLIIWILWPTPIAVFVIILGVALTTGWGAAGVIGAYIVMVSGVVLLATALLYPLAVLGGRVSLRSFQRAVGAGQMVALSTRSSLATLPALMEGGKRHLDLPDAATGFVLPLAATTLKISQAVSPTFLLIFLAHVFGISLTVGQMVSFIFMMILFSATVQGIPRGGSGFNSLPAYVALGIPVEGVILAAAVRTIPDFFLTLINTTTYLTVAVLMSRSDRVGRRRRPRATAATGPQP